MTSRAVEPVPAVALGRFVQRVRRRIGRDPHLLLSVALVAPVVGVQLAVGLDAWWLVGGLSVGFLALQAAFPTEARRAPRSFVALARLGLAVLYVAIVSHLGHGEAGALPLAALYIPIVAMAAALGPREAVVIGLAALSIYVTPFLVGFDTSAFGRERAIALAASGTLIAIGSRRTIASLERTMARMRQAMAADRRRARQLAGVEAVGRLLAHAGPTAAALDEVMDVLAGRFGYRFVSIYLGDETRMRLGAQRGYEERILEFTPDVGVVGRVMRTRQAALVPDVTADPDYAAARAEVQSLVSVPLVTGDVLLGVVNVETAPPDRLDASDLAAVGLVADRLTSALALARERDELARRVALFERLSEFAKSLTSTLELETVIRAVTTEVTSVVPCDYVTLTIRQADGAYRIAAAPGGESRFVGAEIRPGEGVSGRAIEEGRMVVVDAFRRAELPHAVRDAGVPEPLAAAALPLFRNDEVVGAIALGRHAPARPFDALEREVLPLVATQAALAIANAKLHDAAMEASIRDPLTGLYNRRHLDASLHRMSAGRARLAPTDRRPVALLLFDLDEFGRFNKEHGHAVGDDVLRTFARILLERLRASDLLARFGGEEFVVVLDGASRPDAVRLAEEVRERFGRTEIRGINGEALRATVSAGCGAAGPEDATLDGLLAAADVGLAMAKHAGRDRVVAA
jgi:diguanylate cyclase (GGDEF)-like protein